MNWEQDALAVQWIGNGCRVLDQTLLPSQTVYLDCSTSEQIADEIRRLGVRGAPAIGVAAAYGFVLALRTSAQADSPKDAFATRILELRNARPTAVNLNWAIDRMARVWEESQLGFSGEAVAHLVDEAKSIHREDIENNLKMAKFGADLLRPGSRVATHCNAGSLATGGVGTALGVVIEAHRQGKIEHVYTCETRPVLQGLRLTSWELARAEVPFSAICDNMAGDLMRRVGLQGIFVGADRIAANGDVANKVGTYSLAVLAHYHRVPFFVVAPLSTFDARCAAGADIPIEQRSVSEISHVLGSNQPPYSWVPHNPSFDVTPRELVTAWISEKGIVEAPNEDRIAKLVGK